LTTKLAAVDVARGHFRVSARSPTPPSENESMGRALKAVLDGDVAAIVELRPEDLRGASEELIVRREAMLKVLRLFRRQESTPEHVQRWASFLRRGYVADSHGGLVKPLPIGYEPDVEDAMIEIVARLDEIGDAIDGVVSESELDAMIHRLEGTIATPVRSAP
jgi:hypothetical protein